jgi:hypothetical protein
MITFSKGPVVQPFIISIQAEGCHPVNIQAYIRDAFDCTTGTCNSSISDVKFYGYFDANNNGMPDDNNEWILIGSGEHSEIQQHRFMSGIYCQRTPRKSRL